MPAVTLSFSRRRVNTPFCLIAVTRPRRGASVLSGADKLHDDDDDDDDADADDDDELMICTFLSLSLIHI